MNKTKIEWTESTWNPVTGCTPVSEGCTNCYARRMAHRLAGRYGYPKSPSEFDVTLHPDRLNEPLHWKKPRMIFVCSMGDLFHEDVPFEFIDDVFAVAALCPQHTFQCLTKRPERMLEYLSDSPTPNNIAARAADRHENGDIIYDEIMARFKAGPLPNIWLGVTVESPEHYERIAHLKCTPASVRFLSLEPMLAGIKLTDDTLRRLDWVIVGGETGPGAEPMHPAWARSVRDDCQAAGVPFFFKQWGKWQETNPPNKESQHPNHLGMWICQNGNQSRRFAKPHPNLNPVWVEPAGKTAARRLLDGREWDEMPEVKVQ